MILCVGNVVLMVVIVVVCCCWNGFDHGELL